MQVLAASDLIDNAISAVQTVIEDNGYSHFSIARIPIPYETNSGIVWAKGHFYGPPPYDPELRAAEDTVSFGFLILEDPAFDDMFVIEIKRNSAILATYLIKNSKLELVSGQFPLLEVH